MLKRISIFLLLVTIICTAALAKAADFRYTNAQDGSVTITQTDSPHDLHVVAATINVLSAVNGDLVAAGDTVTVSGDVTNSAFLAGSNVSSTGNIGHHLRAAGNNIVISGNVSGDIYVAGQSITIDENSVVAGSVYAAGGSIAINGVVKGSVHVRGATIVINGTIGSLQAQATSVELQSKATVLGDFSYKSPTSALINSSAVVDGQTVYTQTSQPKFAFITGAFTLVSLLTLLGVMVLLSLTGLFWPLTSKRLINTMSARTARMFWIGLVALIVGPILILLALFTFIGTPTALVIGVLWLLAIMLGSLFAQLFTGAWIISRLTKSAEMSVDWQSAVVGTLAFAVIRLIPIVGGLILFVLTLVGFGSVISLFFKVERETV